MSGNIAINPDTGEMLVISPQGQWVPPQRARNPETGAEVFYDGTEWRPIPAARATTPAPAPTAESVGRGIFERNLFDPIERGYQGSRIGIAALRGRSPQAFYGLHPEDAASEIVAREERLRQIPQTEEAQRVARAAEASGSVLGAVGQYVTSPEATFHMMGESVGANPVGGALGAVGAALPTPFLRQIVGALAGALNFPTEFVGSLGQSLLEAARDQGIDPTNREQLTALIRAMNADPALMEKTRNDALLRAGIISAADAAAGGLAGRMAGRGFAGRVGGGAAVEGAGGGLGEAGAQLATEGQISPAAIGAEIVGSGVGGGLGNLTRAGAPPAGPRTREEDENLRTAIDTVTGERDYLDETQRAFDEAERQREARDRANRFPDIRNVEPERYALDNFSLAADLLEARDRKLPVLFGEARSARSELEAVEQAAAAAGIAAQDHPAYGSAKARLDNVEKSIADVRKEIAYLTPRVDPRSTLVGAAEQLNKATENLDYINRTREDARARLAKAKNPKKSKDASKTTPIDLGSIHSIEAEIADLNVKAYAEQRNVARLKQLVPENERQITNLQNRKSFTESASKIAEGKARRAGPSVTDLRAGAAQPGQNRFVLDPQFDKKNRLIGGEAIIRLDPPNQDGSVVAYVNRQINGQVQEVAVPTNVDKIYQFPMRERAPGVPSASLTQEAAGAELGPEQIFGNRLGAAVDPNQMDLNPRRVTDRVGGQNTGTASPEPDYVAPSAPAPAPKAPSAKGVLPEGGDQQQTSTIVPPSEQVSSFNMPLGKVFTIMTPDASMKVNVVAEIVDLKSLVAAYGEFQNRETENVANKATIARIANNPKFELLTTSPYSDRGTPVVGPDNMVEAGNHRVKGLKEAAESNPEGFAGYVQSLRNAGYSIPEGVSYPVLIRRRVSELTHDERVRFCDLSNKEASQSFTAQETAEADVKLIDDDLMKLLKGNLTDGILAAGNAPFVRKFLEKVLTANEYNEAVNDKGGISPALEARITNALFFYAYKNKNLLSKLTNRRDDKTTKKIISGLASATGAMHTLRQGIESFNIRPEFDIIEKLVEATDRIRTAITGLDTADGRKEAIRNIFNTKDLVNDITPLDLAAVRIFLNEEKDGIASAGKIAERLEDYVGRVEFQTTTKDFFGNEKRITPEEALTEALNPGEIPMFSSRNVPTEQDVEAEAESRERKAPPEVERALALIKARLDSLRAKGSQGAALAKALEDALANRKLDANQIYAAFMVDNAILQSMPKGANYEFQFLHDIVLSDKDVAEKAGVKLGTKLQGVKVAPARDGLPGLIKLSLAEDMLPILNETALHEAFHVLQDYFAAYDKGYKAAIDKHFKNDMKVADFEPSIKRRLQALKPPGSEQSYWDLLVEAFKDKNEQDTKIKHGYEAQAYAFGALADAAMRGEKVTGLLPPFQRFFNFLRDTMAALRSGFVGDGFRTPASLLGSAGERAAKYNQQAPRTAGKSFSAKGKGEGRKAEETPQFSAQGLPKSLIDAAGKKAAPENSLRRTLQNIDAGVLSEESTARHARRTSPEGRAYEADLEKKREIWVKVNNRKFGVQDLEVRLREPGLTDAGIFKIQRRLAKLRVDLSDLIKDAASKGVDTDKSFPEDERINAPIGQFPGDERYNYKSYAPEGYPFSDPNHDFADPLLRIPQEEKFSARNAPGKSVTDRDPVLEEAARGVREGSVTREQYEELVNERKAITPYEEVPEPATKEEIIDALQQTDPRKVSQVGTPSRTLKRGDVVGLRLDIPAYTKANTWVVSIHEAKGQSFYAGTAIGYEPTAIATNVKLGVVPKAAMDIATGDKNKSTIAVMRGEWVPSTPENAKARADAAMNNPAWVQVGMDPRRHQYFYDRTSKEPVVAADEVIQIGPLVLAKNPVYADKADYQFSALKAPRKPTTTSPQAGSLNAAGNAQAFYNSVVKRVDAPNVFDSVLAYMFDKKPGEKISAAIARTSVNAAAPLHAFHAMASKDGYTGLSAGRALELQMSNSGRINQILNAGMGKLNAKTGEITLRNDVKPLLQIMDEADVGNDATKKGWLQTYLVALRERDLRKVNRRVFTDTEDQRIADTIREIEAKYPQFKQTAADLDKMNKALIEFALEAGLITKQHASVLSSKFYTPAYREDVDQISNALNVQLGGGVKAINDLYSNIILNADSIMKASLKNLAMKTAAETMKFANVGRENTTGTKSDNTISYRSNGKKVDFDVDDPVLFSALTSMPRETINGIYQAMASTASFFRDLITVAPSFIFKNLYAGKISAYVQEGAPLLNNTFGGVRDALKNTTTLQNFQMQTGFGGMEWGMKPKDMVKTFERKLTDKGMMEAISRGSVFSALRQGFTKLQALSEASEMAERIKLSESLIKKGMSPRDAYFQAYLIAPYSRKGTGAGWLGHTVHFMAPLVPFLNAKLQTTYRLFENEKGSKTILGLPKEIFLRGLVLTAFSTAAYALNLADDEEEWDGRPNYMKLNYDIIPFTSGLVTLPRAYEIGKIFGALPVFALDAIRRNEGRDLTEALLQVATSTLLINPIPKAIEPIIGAVTNYDFFRKQPYESAGEQGLPIQERVRRSTTSIARGVSAGFNSVFGDSLSPIQAQAVLEGYSGTIGTMIMAGFDSLLSAAGVIPGKPAGAFGDPLSMPAIIASTVGLDTFYRDPNNLTSRFVNDFYRVKEMTDQLVRSQTLATNARDYERLQELRGEEGLPLRMRPAVNAASTRIADINKRIRLIERGNLGSLEKTEAIQPLIAQRDQIARRVVDQARNLGIL